MVDRSTARDFTVYVPSLYYEIIVICHNIGRFNLYVLQFFERKFTSRGPGIMKIVYILCV